MAWIFKRRRHDNHFFRQRQTRSWSPEAVSLVHFRDENEFGKASKALIHFGMAKDPKNFTGEDMSRLLKAEKRRLQSREDWKGFGMATMGIGAALLLVACAGFYFFSFLR